MFAGVALILKYRFKACFISQMPLPPVSGIITLYLECGGRMYTFNITPSLLQDESNLCVDEHDSLIVGCDTFPQMMGMIFVSLGSVIFITCALLFIRECIQILTQVENSRDTFIETRVDPLEIHTTVENLYVAEIDRNAEIILAMDEQQHVAYVIEQPKPSTTLYLRVNK